MKKSGALNAVELEMARQNAKWGQQDHPDGTGPDATPLLIDAATGIADIDEASFLAETFTARTDARFGGYGDRPGTWADILLEEVFEALAEDDPERLKAELTQVAAVAAQWVMAIDRRTAPIVSTSEPTG